MPRISSGSTESEGISVTIKVMAAVALIACGIGYMVYQYERLNPARQKARVAAKTKPQDNRVELFDKLNLTDTQKEKLATLESQTTNPWQLHREAIAVLTDEQKAHLKTLRDERQAKQAELKAKREARMQKMYPGNQRQVAEALNKQIREIQQQRRAAAKAATPAPSPANP